MKKQFRTLIDLSAIELEMFYVSAGKPGFSMFLSPEKMAELIKAEFEDIIV